MFCSIPAHRQCIVLVNARVKFKMHGQQNTKNASPRQQHLQTMSDSVPVEPPHPHKRQTFSAHNRRCMNPTLHSLGEHLTQMQVVLTV
jgi:hypothetical protein